MKIRYQLITALGLGILVTWGVLFLNQSMISGHVLAHDQTTEEIFKHISQLAEETGSYRAEITTITKSKGKRKEIKGKVKFRWPNMRWQENHHPTKHGLRLAYIISNGRIRWNYMPSLNFALKYNIEALDEEARQKGWFSTDYFQRGSLQYLGKERLDMEEMYVFEGEQSPLKRPNNVKQSGKARVYFNVKNGILEKVIVFDHKGEEVSIQTFSNIRPDASISAQDFEFIPPEGTKIQEVEDVGLKTNSNQ